MKQFLKKIGINLVEILKSRTNIVSLLTSIFILLQIFGVNISSDNQEKTISILVEFIPAILPILAVYFRVNPKQEYSKKENKDNDQIS